MCWQQTRHDGKCMAVTWLESRLVYDNKPTWRDRIFIFDGLNRFCENFQSAFSPIKYVRVVNSQHRDDKSTNLWNPDREAEISSAADTCSGFFDLLLHLYLFLHRSFLCFLQLSLVADHIPDYLKWSYFPRWFLKQLLRSRLSLVMLMFELRSKLSVWQRDWCWMSSVVDLSSEGQQCPFKAANAAAGRLI